MQKLSFFLSLLLLASWGLGCEPSKDGSSKPKEAVEGTSSTEETPTPEKEDPSEAKDPEKTPNKAETPSTEGDPVAQPTNPPAQPAQAGIKKADLELDASPEDIAKLSAANRNFAVDIYKALAAEEGNLAFSPFSISTALAMTELGARGDTATEMRQVLHFELDEAKLHNAFRALQSALLRDEEKVLLTIGNRLWGAKDMAIRDDFLELSGAAYGAPLELVNFAEAEAARERINAWVEEQTKNKIIDLIPKGVLDAETRLVLTNAIYFKGAWAIPFDEKVTRDQPFFKPAEKQVPMMQMTRKLGYFEDDQVQVLDLGYHGKELSMTIILPRDQEGLAALEASLDTAALDAWVQGLRNQKVKVDLPRFKGESEMELSEILKALGMVQAFKGGDFSGISDESLFISKVIHKAFVEVNEEGAEAAAATAVVTKRTAAISGPKPIPKFIANHPFIYLIRDRANNDILFMGRVVDP